MSILLMINYFLSFRAMEQCFFHENCHSWKHQSAQCPPQLSPQGLVLEHPSINLPCRRSLEYSGKPQEENCS